MSLTPFSAKGKNVWMYTFTLRYTFVALCLIKRGYNFASVEEGPMGWELTTHTRYEKWISALIGKHVDERPYRRPSRA